MLPGVLMLLDWAASGVTATEYTGDGLAYSAADNRPHCRATDNRPHYSAQDDRPHYEVE